jgi:hypothetical protein
MKHIQNNQKSTGKSIPAYGLKNLKKKICESKVFCQMFVISKKENHTVGYGFKNPQKIYSLAYGFFIHSDFHLRRKK